MATSAPIMPGRISPTSEIATLAGSAVMAAFDAYIADFQTVTTRAKRRFEARDWCGHQEDARARAALYDAALERIAQHLQVTLGPHLKSAATWVLIKEAYASLITGRADAALAETFFNSVTRKVFSTVGLHREIEFFSVDSLRRPAPDGQDVYTSYAGGRDTSQAVVDILRAHAFGVPYRDMLGDAQLVAHEIDLHLWPLIGNAPNYSIDVVHSPFYRNKVAYLVARIMVGHHVLPLVLPLYNGDDGVYVDTVLLEPAEVSTVFSFAFSYFHVEITWYDELIAFLKSILPEKPLAEMYNCLGLDRHGKTEIYRDIHRTVHSTNQQFFIAPGREGTMMIVFTLPEFPFVLKVIKDSPCFLRSTQQPPKSITRAQVMAQYDFVRGHDRVGRMVDTLEFENLLFRRVRFATDLLGELLTAAQQSVSLERDHVVIHHVYIQRRVLPLPMYLEQERDPETLRKVVLEFGYFLKDLAAAGIFPLDLFNTWNYGVTRRRRIVIFDYDDVVPIEQANFLTKRAPRDDDEELLPDEDRIVAGPCDFFVDEMAHYCGIPLRLVGIFSEVHHELFSEAFWQGMKARVAAGEVVDIAPYDVRKRFNANGLARPRV